MIKKIPYGMTDYSAIRAENGYGITYLAPYSTPNSSFNFDAFLTGAWTNLKFYFIIVQ